MEQANELLSEINTPEEMRDLIRRLDIRAQGDVTILYSGMLGFNLGDPSSGVMAVDVVRSFVKNKENIRAVDTTEAARFLGISQGLENRNKPALDALERIFNTKYESGSAIYHFLYGDIVNGERVPNGVWDDISERFVADTVGEIVTLTGGANFGRAFAQSEIPAILKSNTITHVDGIPIDILKSYGHYGAYKAITAQSETRAAELRIALDEAGNALTVDGYVVIDARNYLAHTATSIGKEPPAYLSKTMHWVGEMIPDERIRSHAEGITLLREAQFEMKRQIKAAELLDSLPANNIVLRNLSRLGVAADVLDLAFVALDAKAAYQSGDTAKANQLLLNWAVQNLSAFVAGRTAALAFTPLLAAGPAGVALYGVLTIGASIAGGIYGSKLTDWLKRFLDPWNHGFKLNWYDKTLWRSPLVLDLDGDGVETLNLYANDIFFDHDCNGFAERTGWVGPDDGLLILDLNADGKITNGSELFGDHTIDPSGRFYYQGFAALMGLDANSDGYVNSADPQFASLQIWKDNNSNATLDPGEAFALDHFAIQSLSTSHQWSSLVDAQDNQHLFLGHYEKTDGTSAALTDVWFKTNRVDTIYNEYINVTDSIARLPDIPGLGNVYSLHHAMVKDSSGRLQAVVERWVKASSQERDSLIDELIARWAGVYDLLPPPTVYQYYDLFCFACAERFAGRKYEGLPGERSPDGSQSRTMYHYLRSYVKEQLIFGADIVPLLATLALNINNEGPLDVDISGMIAYWRSLVDSGYELSRQLEVSRFLKRQGLGEFFVGLSAKVRAAALKETGSMATCLMLFVADTWEVGGQAKDCLSGYLGDSLLQGGEGNDWLLGGDGRDTLDGGPGNDTLSGPRGQDLYLYARGDGKDLIEKSRGGAEDYGILYFYKGITAADLRFQQLDYSGTILISLVGSDDQLTIRCMVANDKSYALYSPIQEIVFADGARWSYRQIINHVFDGSDLGDTIYGSYDSDLLTGRAGNDTLWGGLGDDTLIGGGGCDNLMGDEGSDIFYGDEGDDTIWGGDGADLYVIGRGSGHDLIHDFWLNGNVTERISFVDGITATDLDYRRSVDDLIIEAAEFGVQLTLKYVFTFRRLLLTVEPLKLEFSDSTVCTYQQICQFVIRGNEQSQILTGYAIADRIDGAGGDDSIWGAAGYDMLLGGAGNDTLSGGEGRDTLDGGPGSDCFDGGTGDDLMLGGDGDDVFKTAVVLSGNDTIYGGAGDDLFVGGAGAESFFGEAGDDIATGGAGGDSLIGGFGSDSLAGGDGADWLQAGPGIDTLSGGAEADRFVFLDRQDAGLGFLNHDLITDFQVGDRIDLAAIDANDELLGDQGFRFIGASRFSGLGQLRYTCANGIGLLEGNCTGRLDADFQLTILGSVSLQPTSFVL